MLHFSELEAPQHFAVLNNLHPLMILQGNSMYEERIVAFIDILGFKSLICESVQNQGITKSILEALNSILPSNLQKDAFGTLHLEKVPEAEKEEALEDFRLFTEAMQSLHEVRINYFSDCVVLSADAQNVIASQTVIDLVGKLTMRLWQDHNLLTRGGITKGPLVHVVNGPLFGPSLVYAYELESKEAVYPRILIDIECYNALIKEESFQILMPYFDTTQDMYFMCLSTVYNQNIKYGSTFMNDKEGREKAITHLKNSPAILGSILENQINKKIIEKYEWLIPRVMHLANSIDGYFNPEEARKVSG